MKNSETKSRLEDKITDYSNDSLRERAKYVCHIHNIDNGLKEQIRVGCYPSIFVAVRKLPKDERRAIVSDFYSGFPNGKDLGAYMNRILEIDWFKPKKNYTMDEITPFVRKIENAFKMKKHSILIVDDWYSARNVADRDAAWYAAGNATDNVARNAVGKAARNAVGKAARNAVWAVDRNAAWDAAFGAGYIIAQDVASLRKEYPVNPFEKLIEVYEKGLWPVGISSEGKFVVLHPKVNKK